MFIFGTMRNTILCTLILLIAFPVFGQQASRQKKAKPYRVEINDASFTNSKPEFGATLSGIYEHDTLMEMKAWFGFSYGDIQRTFFYWKGELITVTEVHRVYNAYDPGMPVDSISPSFNARYVYENGKLTLIKQNGTYSLIDAPQDKASVEAMYLNFSEQYTRALDEKRAVKKNRKK